MSDSETLHFKIGLSGSSQVKHPKFKISINDTEFVNGELKGGVNETEYFEFDVPVAEGKNSLIIEFNNKSVHDTIMDSNGVIIADLLLNIDSVEIDDIDLNSLLWTSSEYRPNYPETYKIKTAQSGQELSESIINCVNLGWNGKWVLPFTSPFYIWLLENV